MAHRKECKEYSAKAIKSQHITEDMHQAFVHKHIGQQAPRPAQQLPQRSRQFHPPHSIGNRRTGIEKCGKNPDESEDYVYCNIGINKLADNIFAAKSIVYFLKHKALQSYHSCATGLSAGSRTAFRPDGQNGQHYPPHCCLIPKAVPEQ